MIQDLAKRLQTSRVSCNFTRKQVAELLDVSESLIGLYESGNRQPSLSALMKLAALYHVTTDYLLGVESVPKGSISLTGLTDKQVQAITLTVQCFRDQNE